MMDESSKTKAVRPTSFYSQFMSGRVLDIGCGGDLVVPHAVPFDQPQGDANDILQYFEPESFDCVHSSHCLEHMRDPVRSLHDWWTLVRPGGVLVTVVPDEDLYEQGVWPSLFNSDHKHTFRLGGSSSWSPVSHDLVRITSELPGATIVSMERHDQGYVLQPPLWTSPAPTWLYRCVAQIYERARRYPRLISSLPGRLAIRAVRVINCPLDQTMGPALAQIQVVARKASR